MMKKMSDVFPKECILHKLSNAFIHNLLLLSERNDDGVARREKESARHHLEAEEKLESSFQQHEREFRRTHREDEDSRNRRRGAVTVRARNFDERRFSPLFQTEGRFRRATNDARVRGERTRETVARFARESVGKGEKIGCEQKRRKAVDIVFRRDTNRGER